MLACMQETRLRRLVLERSGGTVCLAKVEQRRIACLVSEAARYDDGATKCVEWVEGQKGSGASANPRQHHFMLLDIFKLLQ